MPERLKWWIIHAHLEHTQKNGQLSTFAILNVYITCVAVKAATASTEKAATSGKSKSKLEKFILQK
jgi:hypothetical protein